MHRQIIILLARDRMSQGSSYYRHEERERLQAIAASTNRRREEKVWRRFLEAGILLFSSNNTRLE